MPMLKSYLRISKPSDLEDPGERFIFRTLETLPGFLAWGSIVGMILFSYWAATWVAFLSILFVTFWFLRTLWLSFYLWSGFKRMKHQEEVDWIQKLRKLDPKDYNLQLKNWQELYHLIIFPMYQESLEIIRQSFRALTMSDYPTGRMIVVLSVEERAGTESLNAAKVIEREFAHCFFRFLLTVHPKDLPGEIPAKGSNTNWGAKQAKELIIDPMRIPYQDVIVSSLDVDTVVFPKYFSCLTYYYLTCPKPTRTSFQPIPLFINNIWSAPGVSRIFAFSSTFWHTMNQERPEKLITFSSHAMSFQAFAEVGFLQPDVVSDDSRIFWQCFLHYDGDYQVQPIFYPVAMDANVAPSFFKTLGNIYRQQRRWAYGVADIPYFLFGFLKNKKIPLRKKISLGLEIIEGHWSWATAPLLIFFLGWLPLILGGDAFSQTLLSYNLPRITSRIMTFAMIGLVTSTYFSILLLPPKPPQYGRSKYLVFVLEWFLVPITMIFFVAFPALEAQTRLMFGRRLGFWPTEKFRKN